MTDWRDLVQAHLHAHRYDVLKQFEADLSGAEAQFLSQYGVASLKEDHDSAAKARCDAVGQPPPKESYEIVEQSAGRLLVHVPRPARNLPHERPIPFWPTRMLLIEEDAQWKTAGIYIPCISCNSSELEGVATQRKPGKCLFCSGTGESYFGNTRVRGFWIFRRVFVEKSGCEYCGGTGDCRSCGEDMPGWCPIVSLNGFLKPVEVGQEVREPP
jgi:hypothetical protein